MYSSHFVIISSWKRAWPFIWTNWNPHHPRMLFAKFGWNWPSGSWEDENVKILQTDGQTDRQTTDDRWSGKLTWAFSSCEVKTGFFSYTRRLPCCLYDVYNVKGIKKFRKGSRARTSIAWCSFYSKPIKWQRVFFILKKIFSRLWSERGHGEGERVKERRERKTELESENEHLQQSVYVRNDSSMYMNYYHFPNSVTLRFSEQAKIFKRRFPNR